MTAFTEQMYGYAPSPNTRSIAEDTMAKRYDEPIEVSFSWRGRRYLVQRLLKHWRESACTWDPARAVDHDCFRVEADGGTYELRLDRRAQPDQPAWRIARVWD